MEPDEVKFPKPPYDWVDPVPNTANEESNFNKVDNLGGWSSFSYCPVFASVAQEVQYKFHCLPDCCQPVSPNEDAAEIRTHGGCIFPTKGKKEEDMDCVKEKIAEEDPPPYVDGREKLFTIIR